MKIQTIVRKPFRAKGSGSRLLGVGEVHDVDGISQARLLHALGWIEKPQQPSKPAPEVVKVMEPAVISPAPEYLQEQETSHPIQEQVAPIPSAPEVPTSSENDDEENKEDASDSSDQPRQKRAYRRRDLTAE